MNLGDEIAKAALAITLLIILLYIFGCAKPCAENELNFCDTVWQQCVCTPISELEKRHPKLLEEYYKTHEIP